MNAPDEVVRNICSTYYHNEEILASLEDVSNTFSQIKRLEAERGELLKEFQLKDIEMDGKLKAVRDKCRHFFKQHRSGVDSADDYEQCLVCGAYR